MRLGTGGVTDDDVQPAILRRIGVWLVPRVDDRAFQRRLEPDLFLEEVTPLRDLVVDGGPSVLRPYLAGPREDLPSDQETGHVADYRSERDIASDQVVLVRPVGIALAVGVVLVNEHPLCRRHGSPRHGDGPSHENFARLVVEGGFPCVGALRRRVLRMGVIDIEAGTVLEDDIDQTAVEICREGVLVTESASIAPRRLLVERPLDAGPLARVGVDELARAHNRIEVG